MPECMPATFSACMHGLHAVRVIHSMWALLLLGALLLGVLQRYQGIDWVNERHQWHCNAG